MAGEAMALSYSCNSEPKGSSVCILVVDDDPTCLSIVAAILKKFKYEVVTAKHPEDALCTLRIKRETLNLVVSDVHMPDMNGFELQQTIRQEFNLPVVLMSADKGLESGVSSFFLSKPIHPDDVRNLWQFAAKKGSSHVRVVKEENGNDQIISKTDDSDEKHVSSQKGHNKPKDMKRKVSRKDESCSEHKGDNSQSSSTKKAKVVWTNALHNRFLEAIRSIGLERSVPKKILEVMNVPGLTRENVASHLQKYRIFLRRVVTDAKYSDEDKCLSRPSFTRSPSFLINPGRYHQSPGQYFTGSFAKTALFSYDGCLVAQSGLGQSDLISRLKSSVLESNVVRNEGLQIENNDGLIQTNCTTTPLLQRRLPNDESLEDFVDSWVPSLNGIGRGIGHRDVSSQSSDGSSNIVSDPMLSRSFTDQLIDPTDYLDTITSVQDLAESGSRRRYGSITTALHGNVVPINNANAANTVSLPNDSISIDQLLSHYFGDSCPPTVASDSKLVSDVIADNQNLLLPSNTASSEFVEVKEQIHQSASFNPMYDFSAFDYLIDTELQPLSQEANLNDPLQCQMNIQNQTEDNGVETITTPTFCDSVSSQDSHVLSLDQTAFNQGAFSTPCQFNNTLLSDSIERFDEEFLTSLLDSAPFEQP